jgi:hypothetical protein
MGFTLWQYHYGNTTHKYMYHTPNTHITQSNTTKNKQTSSQSYTNSEGHITANKKK